VIYEEFLRPLLFALSPDSAHDFSHIVFEKRTPWRLLSPILCYEDERLSTSIFGMSLPSPLGLSAGYDKDATITGTMMYLGFGFVTVGSVLGRIHPGNRRPRLVRLQDRMGLVNAFGLNSDGVDRVVERFRKVAHLRRIIGSVAGYSVEEYVRVVSLLQPLVDAVEINVTCPMFNGTWCEHLARLEGLLDRINGIRTKPMLVKVPPYADDAKRDGVLDVVDLCQRKGFGVAAANARIVPEPRLSPGYGGLSGRPIASSTKRMIRDITVELGKRTPLIACGGISTGRDVFELIGYGADACELLTSFVYRGPSTPKKVNMELVREMKEHGFRCIEELKGALVSR
jgi:dihydroorotate dehydrogenase